MMDPCLSLSMLGTFQISQNRQPVTGFESKKVRGLFAYLVAEADQPHSRESLAGMFWPDLSSQAAFNNLRFSLCNLRKIIGDREAHPEYLWIRDDTIQFNSSSDYSLDLQEFYKSIGTGDIEQLEKAVSLYRGPFLEGFSIPDSAEFEDWLLLKREQVNRGMLGALRKLAQYEEANGRYDRVQQYCWHMIEIEPWQEEGHQQLMRVLALDGQRSAALAQYEACRRILSEELNIEPSPETTALYRQIADDIPPVFSAIPGVPAFLDQRKQPGQIEPQIFVARKTELEKLNRFLNNAMSGRGQAAFITGEAGSGKSMLMEEFARHAVSACPDLILLNGNCNAFSGSGDPYLPFIEMLSMLAGEVEARWSAGLMTREHASRLWRLLPEVLDALIDAGPDLIDRFIPDQGLTARARMGAPLQLTRLETLLESRSFNFGTSGEKQIDLFEQYLKVLQKLAGSHPILLIVDDLQWADAGSVNLLFHLGKHLHGHRILLLGAYRSSEILLNRNGKHHPIEQVINEFRRDYGDNLVDLSAAEGRCWIDALIDSEPNRLGESFRNTLFRHTNGHALFTIELLRGMQERGDLLQDDSGCWIEGSFLNWETLPPRVEAVIAERINRLPELGQSILSIASVEGEFFTAQAISKILSEDEQEISRCLDSVLLKQQRLILQAGVQRLNEHLVSRYRFRHILFQIYLYNRLEESEKVYLHERVGNALEEIYREQVPGMAAQLARHFEIARLFGKAVQYLKMAGDHAYRLSAYAETVEILQHAIDLSGLLPDPQERCAEELRIRNAMGAPLLTLFGFKAQEAEINFRRAIELGRLVTPSEDLFSACTSLQSYYKLQLMLPEACAIAEEMVTLSEKLKGVKYKLIASLARSTTALYAWDIPIYDKHKQRIASLYDRDLKQDIICLLGCDVEVALLAHAAWVSWIMGYPDQACRNAMEACVWAEEVKHPFSTAYAYYFRSKLYIYQREFQQVRPILQRSKEVADEYHLAFWSTLNLETIGYLLVHDGFIDEGCAQLERAHAIQKDTGSDLSRIMNIPDLAWTYAMLGRYAEGLALLEEALKLSQASGFRLTVPDFYLCRGDILFGDKNGQRMAEAAACYHQALKYARQMKAKSWELRAALKLCGLWQRQGKSGEINRMLSPIYTWFSEGFDTPDLRDARTLLEQVSGH